MGDPPHQVIHLSIAQADSGKQELNFADCILGCLDHIFLPKRHFPQLLTTLPFLLHTAQQVFHRED